MRIISMVAGLCVALAACSAPSAPDQEQHPDPQASSPITETADTYKNAARDAAAQTEAQAAAQARAADDAGAQ